MSSQENLQSAPDNHNHNPSTPRLRNKPHRLSLRHLPNGDAPCTAHQVLRPHQHRPVGRLPLLQSHPSHTSRTGPRLSRRVTATPSLLRYHHIRHNSSLPHTNTNLHNGTAMARPQLGNNKRLHQRRLLHSDREATLQPLRPRCRIKLGRRYKRRVSNLDHMELEVPSVP
jgi:hypothetical protein